MQRIISFILLTAQFVSLIIAPLAYAYPVLTYSGQNEGMHFSPEIKDKLIHESIYFHVYKGGKPSASGLKNIIRKAALVNKNFQVKVLESDAPYQKGQHRILIGPVDVNSIEKEGNALKAKGIDNFPVYLSDDAVSLIVPTSLLVDARPETVIVPPLKEPVPAFKYSDELSQAATMLDGTESSEDLTNKAKEYIKSETESYINSNVQDWLSQYGTAKVEFSFDSDFKLQSGGSRPSCSIQ